jgi:allantoicase
MTNTAHALHTFEDLVDLANEKIGGAAIACSDDFFAGMDSLVKAKEAVWDEDAYGDRGKWMDGWESKRSHLNGPDEHEDWCVVRLGAPGVIRGVVVDTAFFRGNYPSHCAIEGTSIDGYPDAHSIHRDAEWVPLLGKSALQGNAKNRFEITSHHRVTHVRLRIFPDGGVARLRVFGEPIADLRLHGGLDNELDLAAAELGAIVESCSDMFFGSRHNLLFPGQSGGMHDGWETRRSRRVGHDWAVVRLSMAGTANRIVVDTAHFKGNCPSGFALDACHAPDGNPTAWTEVLARTELRPHTKHVFHSGITAMPATHVRLRIDPDGGVARFRLYGRLSEAGQQRHRMRRLSSMLPAERVRAMLSCCGSKTWAAAMAKHTFVDDAGTAAQASAAFATLSEADWLEAFAAHPRIGGSRPIGVATATSQHWSGHEQAGVGHADDAVKQELVHLNDEYQRKHGFIYIIKATGKSAPEMLDILKTRVHNDRHTELKLAAAEQEKITLLRLLKLC